MTDHREMMQTLALRNGWKQGIELGLGSGMLFDRLLGLQIRMIGVDMGVRPDRRARIEGLISDPEKMPYVERVYWMTTQQAAPLVPDGWADFVFIDAGHSYEAVKADIAAWLPKVKPGGWFGGHDYHKNHPGVIRAVDEAFGKKGVEYFDGYIWARKSSAVPFSGLQDRVAGREYPETGNTMTEFGKGA